MAHAPHLHPERRRLEAEELGADSRVAVFQRGSARSPKRCAMPEDDQVIDKSTDDARAGVTGHNVRWVLVAGTTAAIAFMIVIAAVTLH